MGAEEIRQKLLGKFREVTTDRVEKISAALLQLEKGKSRESTEELARELHTLKGEARMMGFTGLSQVVHAAEDLLVALISGDEKGDRLEALLKACDSIPAFLEGPPDGGPEGRALIERLRGLIGAAPAAKTATAPAAAAAEAPAPAKAAPEAPPPRVEAAAAPSRVEGGAEARGPEAPRAVGSAASIRVAVQVLDELAAMSGDLLVDGARSQARTRELGGLLARWNRLSERIIGLSDQLRGREEASLVEHIETDIHTLRSDGFRFLRRHTDAVDGIQSQFDELAARVSSARLVPLASIFAAFPRAARDLAKEQKKEIDCAIQGGESGVDRTVLIALNDPMVHLIRNAIDHGLELPEERVQAGKPRAGKLSIRARVDGDLLAVVVEDDGRGIDPNQIRQAAVRKGVLGEAQAASLSSRAAMDLIFSPGFSTRAETSEVSGRGVGLDVVRKKVVAMGGTVAVESTVGKGTRFVLRLPQSLALMKVLLVRLDDDVYGLPAQDVDGVGRIDPANISELAGIRTVRHRGKLLPVVALGPLLGLNGGPRNPKPLAAFLSHGNDGAALVVDGFHGEREVAVKAPGAFLKGMRFISGGAALEDGRVALLLSTAELVASARRWSNALQVKGKAKRRLRILLVDDSVIAREAEAAMLRGLGHEVEEASDGEDGWRRLESGQYDLLVSDVQMPVLDGINLTRRVKGSPRFQQLPVVILSSLSAPEERRRGADAGADAYLVKGELDSDVMASTVERLCGVAS
jgi:two-component system chemotaxis sensor kinase CheA/two-component system sensor histidine kinase and response regulator WspE